MGHSNSSIYEKFYQNRYVTTDIAAAILKTPSRSSLLASVGHIGIDRDPRAPLRLHAEERKTALANPNFIAIEVRIKNLNAEIYGQHYRLTGQPDDSRKKEMKALRNSRQSLRKRLLKEAVHKKRGRFFDHIDSDDIRQNKCGVLVTYTPTLPVYALTARNNLANIFSRVDPYGATTNQRDRRIEALSNLIELCHIREPHHMNPASTACKGATVENDTTTCLEEVSNDVQDLQDVFKAMELVPLILPSTMCLFCLGDDELTIEGRTVSFSRIDSLRRHTDDKHLKYYDPDTPLLCPHPSCDISLHNVNHFKNHAATVHNVFLSK